MAAKGKKEAMEGKDPLVRKLAMELGRNVRTLRLDQNLSQERLAYMIKTKHPRISNIERGLVDARLTDIVELSRALDVDPAELLNLHAVKLADNPLPSSDGHVRL